GSSGGCSPAHAAKPAQALRSLPRRHLPGDVWLASAISPPPPSRARAPASSRSIRRESALPLLPLLAQTTQNTRATILDTRSGRPRASEILRSASHSLSNRRHSRAPAKSVAAPAALACSSRQSIAHFCFAVAAPPPPDLNRHTPAHPLRRSGTQ